MRPEAVIAESAGSAPMWRVSPSGRDLDQTKKSKCTTNKVFSKMVSVALSCSHHTNVSSKNGLSPSAPALYL